MGKADREIVLESLGCFNDVASLATAIGLPEEMVGEQFAAYDRMADAAPTEASLLSLLDNDDPDEGAVRSAVATLSESSAYWPTELLARGDAWVAQTDAEAGEREAEAARLDQIREQEEKEREEQARTDRAASALDERDATDRAAEADRMGEGQEAADMAGGMTKG